jgi:hypothetical protein
MVVVILGRGCLLVWRCIQFTGGEHFFESSDRDVEVF